MAWFTPPPLVPKEDLRTVLPPGVKPERLRHLVLTSALVGAAAGSLVGVFPLAIFYSSLKGYGILLLSCSAVLGMAVSTYLALRAIRAALIYGTSLESKNTSV